MSQHVFSAEFRPLASARAALFVLATLVAMAAAPRTANAQQELGFFGYGGRAGFSVNPDQFTIGAYAKLGNVSKMFKFRPSVDFGFGDSVFSVLGNADAQVDFVDVNGSYKPFAGGGLGLAYYDFDGGDASEIGINVYGGVERNFGTYNTGYVEARVGIDEMPDFKITFGYGWY